MFRKLPTPRFGSSVNKMLVLVVLMVLAPVAYQVLVLVVARLQGTVYRLVAPVIPVLLVAVVLGAIYWLIFRGFRRR